MKHAVFRTAERGWMEITEIILLAAGGVIFILSFMIPDRREKKRGETISAPMAKEDIKLLVAQEMDVVREHVDDVVNEAVTYAIEKTERSLERLSNEKIMAINEYSDTVMSEIHRNHEEAMFLYDMLNSKHTNLKETVSMVNQTVKTAEDTVNTFQRLVPETVITAPVLEQPSVEDGRVSVLKTDKETSSVYSAPKAAFVREAEEMMEKEPVADVLPANNSNDRILLLRQQGLDHVSIAKKLGLGVGEVKLVIDLFDSEKKGK